MSDSQRTALDERVVLALDSHGGEYFFFVLEAVVLLNHREPRDTTIVVLPVDAPFVRLGRWLARLGRPDFARRDDGPEPSGSAGQAAYARVQRGETVVVERPGYRIRSQRARPRRRDVARWMLASLRTAARAWWSAFAHGRFQPRRFLELTCQGVPIGDLVASTFFRTSPRADRLRPVPRLFGTLWWACYLLEATAALVECWQGREIYAHTPEPTYVHSVPQRLVKAAGGHTLALSHPYDPMLARDRAGEDADVERYFHERLVAPGRVMWYMADGANANADAEAPIRDESGEPLRLDPDGLHAVLFLHSLTDGQFYFGVDGFESVAQWTYHTIERVLANRNVDRLLIKPHPIVDYHKHPVDRRLLENIRRYAQRDHRVAVLDPTTSLVSLSQRTKLVGITHHGSVAEELVYLGQPVISSTFSRWSDHYRFTRLWSQPHEYDLLLAQLSRASWRPPTPAQRAELFRFMRDVRLRELPEDRVNPTFILARLSRDASSTRLSMPHEERVRHARRLEALSVEDPAFQRVLGEFDRLAAEVAP